MLHINTYQHGQAVVDLSDYSRLVTTDRKDTGGGMSLNKPDMISIRKASLDSRLSII